MDGDVLGLLCEPMSRVTDEDPVTAINAGRYPEESDGA